MATKNAARAKAEAEAQAVQAEMKDAIIASIKEAQANDGQWVKPWQALLGSSFPIRGDRGLYYSGRNVYYLMWNMIDKGYDRAVYATFNQWTAIINGILGEVPEGETRPTIKKGETGTYIERWSPWRKCECQFKQCRQTGDGHRTEASGMFGPIYFKVFNIQQVEGITIEDLEGDLPDGADVIEEAERVIAATGITIHHKEGDRAYYVPARDEITLPERDQFKGTGEYYGTAFHEIGHATGHESRLGRHEDERTQTLFGSDTYAFEELVAELTSVFVNARLGIEPEPHKNSGKYLASWLRALEGEDGDALLDKAMRLAARAAGWIFEQAEAEAETEDGEVLVSA